MRSGPCSTTIRTPLCTAGCNETVGAFEKRLSAIVDPRERDHAQQAALILIKTTLQKWSENPPVRH